MPNPFGLESFGAANWDGEVLASKVPVVVGFWADWCVPCHIAAPALADAARAQGGRMRFGVVSFDDEPDLARRYDVRGLPTVLVMVGGEVCARRVGLMGREALQRLLESCATG